MKNNKRLKPAAQEEAREQLISKITYLLHRASLEQLREIKIFVENYIL